MSIFKKNSPKLFLCQTDLAKPSVTFGAAENIIVFRLRVAVLLELTPFVGKVTEAGKTQTSKTAMTRRIPLECNVKQ